jgi:hypothetical protein
MFRAMFSPIIGSTWLYLQYLVVFTQVACVLDELKLQFQLIHRPKHLEAIRNNKLTCIIASRWLLS